MFQIRPLPLLVLAFTLLSSNLPVYAVNVPASQLLSGLDRARQEQEQTEKLKKRVEQPKEVKKGKKKPAEAAAEAPNAPKIMVKKITVEGVTVFPQGQITAMTAKYENKELTLQEIQKTADQITDIYRKAGYIASRAYIPAQKMEGGTLEIRVNEARIGEIRIKGNRYFSTRLISSYLTVKKGDIFNYEDLKRDLDAVNAHPDRGVKAVLGPGQEPGSMDILLNVTDVLPLHLSLGYDNFISYFARKNEYTSTFTDNNLTGHDDILTVQYNRGDANDYYYYSGRYVCPVTKTLDLGFSYSRSTIILGRQLTGTGAAGESKMWSVFGDQKLIKNDNLSLDLTFGFDYKDVDNFLQGVLSSRDDLRVPKTGLDLDIADDWGRTIISDEIDYGIPGIMGGDKKDIGPTDMPTSRAGADGMFFLDTLNVLRLQKLIWDSTLLWKNQFQFSPSILTATEQFQAGGPSNNRGFGISDAVGDQAYAMSWEVAIPPYFIPKSVQIPYFKTRAYDAVRFIGFYDWTNLHKNKIQPGELKNDTLSSAGCGFRVNLGQNLYLSYSIGWPIAGHPTDGKRLHQWLQLTVTF
jgi:hemolysin activation/secretion protein